LVIFCVAGFLHEVVQVVVLGVGNEI